MGRSRMGWLRVWGPRVGGSGERGSTWWVLPRYKKFGLSPADGVEKLRGRAGVFKKYLLGSLGFRECLAIPRRHSDVFGRGGGAPPPTRPCMGSMCGLFGGSIMWRTPHMYE